MGKNNSGTQRSSATKTKTARAQQNEIPPSTYKVALSLRFLLLSIGLGILTPYYLGRVARGWLVASHHHQVQQEPSVSSSSGSDGDNYDSLPPPVLGAAKHLPSSTRYTTKHYAKGTGSESFLVRPQGQTSSTEEGEEPAATEAIAHQEALPERATTKIPSLTFVQQASLKRGYVTTESQIVDLLNDLVAGSNDTILSYHCHHHHDSPTTGVSCVGIAPHGHIALHTFSDHSDVIALTVIGIELDMGATEEILGGKSLSPLSSSQQESIGVLTSSTPQTTTTTTKPAQQRRREQERLASALTHPALFAYDEPEQVVLVGGSSSSLKQILLHNTIERVILLDMVDEDDDEDRSILNRIIVTSPTTEKSSSSSSSSSDDEDEQQPQQPQRVGAAPDAAEVVLVTNQTAEEWFANSPDESIDIVLIASTTKANPELTAGNITRVLKESGMLVIQSGNGESDCTSKSEIESKYLWIDTLTDLEEYDVIKSYDHTFNNNNHNKNKNMMVNFLMALKDGFYLGHWYANEAEINLKIHQRIPTSPLPHFDGAIMQSYLALNRFFEDEFCELHEDNPICDAGHGFDPYNNFVPISSFEVKLSTVPNAGRGVYSTHDVEEGDYTFIDGCVENIHVPHTTVEIMDDFVEGDYKIATLSKWETLMWYTHGYGFVHEEFGTQAHDVDPGIGTFVNHGCNGTTNVGQPEYMNLTEFTKNPAASSEFAEDRAIYHPAFDRSIRTYACGTSVALRKIQGGEEIFNNYMTFESSEELESYAEKLRNECAGRAVGQVSEYELSVQGNQLLRPHMHVNATTDKQAFGADS